MTHSLEALWLYGKSNEGVLLWNGTAKTCSEVANEVYIDFSIATSELRVEHL